MLENSNSAFTSVWIRGWHQNIAWRWPVGIAEVQVVERFEETQPSSIEFPSFDDFLQELDLLFHFQGVDHFKGLIFSDDVEVKKTHDFDKICEGFLIQYFLKVFEDEFFVVNGCDGSEWNGLLGFLFSNTLLFVDNFRCFFLYRPIIIFPF